MRTLALLLLTPALAAGQTTLYTHAHILTGENLLTAPVWADSLAVQNGYVTATGTQAALRAQYPQATLVDLNGATVLPGLNDSHVHLGEAARLHLSLDLTGTPSLPAMLARVHEAASHATPGHWITGGNWDHTLWPTHTLLPTREDLDRVSPANPVFLTRIDGHIAVANSLALAAAGLTPTTPAPQGSALDLDPSTHQLTGIVREAPAMRLVQAHIPPPTPAELREGLLFALHDAVSHGLTSVQDNSDWSDFLLYEQLEQEHLLPLRITEWLPFDAPLPQLEQMRAHHPATDHMLHTGMLKGFMDGSLGSRTAALYAPYSDDPSTSGLPRYDQDKLDQMSAERAAAGFQLGFHAIGDEANDMALNAFAAAQQTAIPASAPPLPEHPDATVVTTSSDSTTPSSFRLRIEHAQVLLPADFNRFHSLGVIASMQPSHLLTDMNWAAARLGPERSKYAYAWRSMLDHHIPLAFGTDYPVESINPFRGLYAAVTRQNEAATQTFHPEQRISLPEALLAYTQTPAFAEFRETTKGRIAPGFLADIIVLDRDPLKATPQDLLHTRVTRTIVAGRTVFSLAPAPAPAQ